MATVQEALEARNKRLKEETEAKQNKVSSALDAYKISQQIEAQNDLKNIYDSINLEIEKAQNLSAPSWGKGSLLGAAKSTLESRANISNLTKRLESYKSYLDEKTYTTFSNTLKSLSDGYNSYLGNAKQREEYASEEQYKWLSDFAQTINNAPNDPDFQYYVEEGKKAANPTWNDANGGIFIDAKHVNNMVTFAEANRNDAWKASAQALRGGGGGSELTELALLITEHMKDEEKAVYNYLIGKGDQLSAMKYLEQMTDVLRKRAGQKIANQADEAWYNELLLSGAAGFESFGTGIKNLGNFLTGDSGEPTSALSYAHQYASENNEGFMKVVNDLSYTVGNMLPSIAVGAVTGGLGGAITMGASAMGNSYAEMRELGYDEWQSRGYGLLVGVSEATLQYVIGGISPLGKANGGMLNKATEAALKQVDNGLARFAIKVGSNMFEEGFEEAAQSVLEPIFKSIFTGEAVDVDWEEVAYSALLGALSGGMFEGVPAVVGIPNTVKNNINAKKIYGSDVQALVTESLEIDPDNAHAQRMQTRINDGKNISGYQIKRLVESNESAMINSDSDKINSAIKNRLLELGEVYNVDSIAEALTKQAIGEKLTSAEKRAIHNSKYGYRVATEVNPENVGTGNLANKWAEDIETERINTEAYNPSSAARQVSALPPEKEAVTENIPVTEKATGAKIEVSEKRQKAEGEVFSTDVQSVEINGDDAKYTLSNGETVSGDKVDFASENMEIVADVAVDKVSRVKGFTNEAATAMIKGYDESISPMKYINAFGEAFALGAKGIGFSEVRHVLNKNAISEKTAHVAYLLGQQSAENSKNGLKNESKNGTINKEKTEGKNESTESVRLRNGSKRNGSKNSEGSLRSVESGTGKAESRGEVRRIADSEAATLLNEGREVTVADLGIRGGSSEATVRVLSKSQETAKMKKARKAAEARGLKIKFIVGDNMLISEENGTFSAINGYILGDNIIVRVDHPLYTADQITRHEIGHDMVAKGEVDIDKVRERLAKMLDPEDYQAVAEAYADAYRGTNLDADAIFEELICDSLGDMNIYAERNAATAAMLNPILPEIKKAASESKSPTKTRGSPEGKASRETKDLYTATDAFKREVPHEDRQAFARSLAFETSGIIDGETKLIYIYSTAKVYVFEADGYMHGEMISSFMPRNKQMLEDIKNEYDKVDQDTENASLWAETVRSKADGRSGDSGIYGGGRSDSSNTLYENSSERNSTGDLKRKWENPQTKKELIELVNKVREIYGFDAPDIEKQGKASRELDSNGNELSEEQVEFFKDSKVRDANGNLLVVRHGTNAEFNVFDFSKIGSANGKAEGYGFYFSDDYEITSRYGKNQKEVYLNITKPLSKDKTTIQKAEFTKFVNALIDFDVSQYDDEGLTWQDSFVSNYVYTYDARMTKQRAVREFVDQLWDYHTNDVDLIYEVATADGKVYSPDTMREFYDVLGATLGYDGIIAEWTNKDGSSKVYVTFKSEQSKNVSNKAPTTNPDIRFSRELEALDQMKEGEANLTKTQKVAKVRGELERMNVGKGEIMAVTRLSDKMFESYAGESKISDFRYELLEATKLALNGTDEGFEAAYELIHTLAKEVAYNPKDAGGDAQLLAEIKREIRGTRMSVHETDKTSGEFDSYGGYGAFRKSHLGKFMLANDGVQADVLYAELQDLYGKSFFPDVNTVSEQLLQMAKLMDTPLSDYMLLSDAELESNADEIVQSLFAELGDIWGRAYKSGKPIVAVSESDGLSNRSLLANALESAVQHDIEREKLKQYKEKIDLINSEDQKLLELRTKIKELSFVKGQRDTEAIKKLQFEANQAANRINTYDRQLLNLESTKALKGVLEREKAYAHRRIRRGYLDVRYSAFRAIYSDRTDG